MKTWIQRRSLAVTIPILMGLGLSWAFGALLIVPTSPSGNRPVVTSSNATGNSEHENSSVLHVDESSFDELVLHSDERVLVDFYADWCGPCQQLAPFLNELADEMTGVRIAKVNFDNNDRLARTYRVRSLPTLLVFDNGEVVSRYVGAANKDRLTSLLTD